MSIDIKEKLLRNLLVAMCMIFSLPHISLEFNGVDHEVMGTSTLKLVYDYDVRFFKCMLKRGGRSQKGQSNLYVKDKLTTPWEKMKNGEVTNKNPQNTTYRLSNMHPTKNLEVISSALEGLGEYAFLELRFESRFHGSLNMEMQQCQ